MTTETLDPVTARRVQVLRDRQEISDVMLHFGRALDLHDWGNPTLIDASDPACQAIAHEIFGGGA